jgi:D-alanyl-D-alanine carboxypeptidase (penicillin-binding protein 5/6)
MNFKVLHKAVIATVAAFVIGSAGLSGAAAPAGTPAKTVVAKPVVAPAPVAAKPVAAAPAVAAPAVAATPQLPAMDTIATHAILVDVGTGSVLLAKDPDGKMPTSSMSKTVSLYLIFDALKKGQWKLSDELPVSEKAWKMGGSKMFIKVGDKVKVEDLIRGVATISGNDAVVCLAEGLAGSEDDFTERLNALAKQLGMNNSHFMNASGWPVDGHYSTPRDLAIIGQHLVTDFPEYYHFFSEPNFSYMADGHKITQPATDPLIGRVPGVDGIKTGHTDIAGYGIISSAQRSGRRLILVVNGLPTEQARATESARLLEWGFRNFENDKIIGAGEEVEQAKVWLGQEKTVPLVTDKDVTVVLPIAKRDGLKMSVTYNGPVEAPIRKGTVIGKLHIVIPDQQPQDIDLLAGRDVEREGIFGRVSSRLHYLLYGA